MLLDCLGLWVCYSIITTHKPIVSTILSNYYKFKLFQKFELHRDDSTIMLGQCLTFLCAGCLWSTQDLERFISAPWFVTQQQPLAYQPEDQLYCVRAEYTPIDPNNLLKGLVVKNYANRGTFP